MSFARRLAKAHEETSVRILVRIALDLACVGKSVSVVCGWSVWVLGAAIVKTLLSSKTNRMRDGSASSQIEGAARNWRLGCVSKRDIFVLNSGSVGGFLLLGVALVVVSATRRCAAGVSA